jgi:hypothetical protein
MPVRIEVSGEDARHAQREMLDMLRGSDDLHNEFRAQRERGRYLASIVPPDKSLDDIVENNGEGDEQAHEPPADSTRTGIPAASAAPAAEPKKRGRKPKAEMATTEPEPQIRTDPENRIDPESPKTSAQDAADEAAEVEAARDPVKPLTLDDVRQAVGEYVKRYGMPATQEDGVNIFVQALGNPPTGEPIWKMSILPDDQDVLGRAVAGWKAAIEGNPYGRKAVA